MRILLAILLTVLPLSAQDLVARPYVAVPIKNVNANVSSQQKVIWLSRTFALRKVNGPVVRFATARGPIDVGLARDVAPATVKNFLKYVKNGSYNRSFFHRSVPGFIIQGGGFRVTNDEVEEIPQFGPVVNEFDLSNTRGTIAMAKLGGDPDSATNQWFFNESDDNASNLDSQNGGFTVFGRIIDQAGLDVMDTIAALKRVNAGSPFDNLPVVNHKNGSGVTTKNLVRVNAVKILPMLPNASKSASVLRTSVSWNSNPKVVKASITKNRLILRYTGKKGTSNIRVKAKSRSGGVTFASFTVRVK